MQVGIAVLRHVVIDDNVDSLHIHASAEDIGAHQNALLELLECLKPVDAARRSSDDVIFPRLVGKIGWQWVKGHGREVLLLQKAVQGQSTLHGLHEDHNLVELQHIKKVNELLVLRPLVELHVVLEQAVQPELGLGVHGDLVWPLHELLAQGAGVLTERGAEHHHLLLLGRLHEDLLHIFAHVKLVQALITLVKDKLRHLVELQILLPHEAQQATRSANHNLRRVGLQHLLVLGDGSASVNHSALHVREVLGKAVELVLDLVGQLAGVANHHHLDSLLAGIDLLKTRQDEHGRLAHARLGLAQDVSAQNGLRDALVLHL
mmetsp:Transcript_67163/g.108167  ORF Transcript_67163/g.108167 Transcript_67163/m.108167 type:complete len:319 (+) Transcript_67163:368-1324(+)